MAQIMDAYGFWHEGTDLGNGEFLNKYGGKVDPYDQWSYYRTPDGYFSPDVPQDPTPMAGKEEGAAHPGKLWTRGFNPDEGTYSTTWTTPGAADNLFGLPGPALAGIITGLVFGGAVGAAAIAGTGPFAAAGSAAATAGSTAAMAPDVVAPLTAGAGGAIAATPGIGAAPTIAGATTVGTTGLFGLTAADAGLIGTGVNVIGGLIGGAVGSSAAKGAANTQADAARQAAALQWAQYMQSRQDLAPYREAGYGALASAQDMAKNPFTYGGFDPSQYNYQSLQALDPNTYRFDPRDPTYQLPGTPTPGAMPGAPHAADFGLPTSPTPGAMPTSPTPGAMPNVVDPNAVPIPGAPNLVPLAFQAPGSGPGGGAKLLTDDPGYQFRLEQGQKTLERTQAGRGNFMSGAALKEAQNYAQGMASQEYGAAYNRAFDQNRENYARQMTQYGITRENALAMYDRQQTRYGQEMQQQGTRFAQGQQGFTNEMARQGTQFAQGQQGFTNEMAKTAARFGMSQQEFQNLMAQQGTQFAQAGQVYDWQRANAETNYQRGFAGNQMEYERNLAANMTQEERNRYQNQNAYQMASEAYKTNFNVQNALNDKQWNRYASLAGVGQTAATQLGQFGQQAAGQQGQYMTNAGNAQAAGQVGSANAWNSAFGNVGNAFNSYLNYQLLSQGLKNQGRV